MGWAAYAIDEFGLEETRDAEGWGGEGYAERWIGPDEDVLNVVVC